MEDYITIELGSSFLLNAGILGLLKMLYHGNAKQGSDYIIDNQVLKLSKDYILDHDFADIYIKALVDQYKKDTKFFRILSKQSYLEHLQSKVTKDKDDIDKIINIYKELTAMLEKNSFVAGYEILYGKDIKKPLTLTLVQEFKKEKEEEEKYQKYINLCAILSQPEVEEVLVMKELMYSKINLFFENTSFFLPANLKKDIKECYYKDFVQPLIKEITSEKQGKKRCIECSCLAEETRSISFMIDTTDDTARKKSHYWNQKVDAFVCPICAFLYTLVPLGFQFCGSDAVFINDNSNIPNMEMIMSSYKSKLMSNNMDEEDSIEKQKASAKSKLYRIFTSDGIEMVMERSSNLQVIVRLQDKKSYEMNIISKDTIAGFQRCVKYLRNLEGKFVLQDNKFISVYDEVMDNLLSKRKQYPLIHKLIMRELKGNTSTNYIRNILMIQLKFKGGDSMEQLIKYTNVAFSVGKAMREELTKGVQMKDKDNHLRGLVYKLSNALSVKDRAQFLDTIIRAYSGKGVPIPAIFKECYQSDDLLEAIGNGFILGLKYVKYEGNDKEGDNNE